MKLKIILPLAVFILAFSSCKKDESYPLNPLYDLDISLHGETKGAGAGAGFIKFRQDPDPAKIITLDIWVQHLEPNREYLLQRAVDLINEVDGNCTSISWLTLGKGLVAQSIRTEKTGKGNESLWRDVSAALPGSKFDIHFQVVDAVSMAVVLNSDCYEYVVR